MRVTFDKQMYQDELGGYLHGKASDAWEGMSPYEQDKLWESLTTLAELAASRNLPFRLEDIETVVVLMLDSDGVIIC